MMDKAELEAIRLRVGSAHKMVTALCKPRGSAGARDWMMSIPARPDHDPDLVIDRSLRDIHALLAEVEELLAVKESHEQQLNNLAKENDELHDANEQIGKLYTVVQRNSYNLILIKKILAGDGFTRAPKVLQDILDALGQEPRE